MTAKAIRSFRDLEVYQEGFRLSLEVFKLTQRLPKEELYGLTAQMRNAARSVPANVAEGWAKRLLEMIFKRQLLDAIGSANEMLAWLDMSHACDYICEAAHNTIVSDYATLGRRLHQLMATWKTFK